MSTINYYRDQDLPYLEIKNCNSGIHSAKQHSHEEFSFGVILKGTSTITGEGRDYQVQPGMAILIPPRKIHKCNPTDYAFWQFQMLFIKAEWIASTFGLSFKDLSIAVKILSQPELNRILNLFRVLQTKSGVLEKETRLITALSQVFDFESYFQIKPIDDLSNSNAIKKVKQFLDENFLERIALDDLAAYSGLSKYYLLRSFKKNYQTSVHAYQTMLRINLAKAKFRSGKYHSITAVAQDTGFYDQSHFVKVFKDYSGITPSEYCLGK